MIKNSRPKQFRLSLTSVAFLVGIVMTSLFAVVARATSVQDDVGYTKLTAELGISLPTGARVNIAQTEAGVSPPGLSYVPDTSQPDFSSKNFVFRSGISAVSGHATTVGFNYYGLTTSLSPGVTNIEVYDANDWIDNFLHPVSSSKPETSLQKSRVTNHSWVGDFFKPNPTPPYADDQAKRTAQASAALANANALFRSDWLVETDDNLQIVGVNNGANNAQPLMATAMNAISVGLTNANGLAHSSGSVSISITDPNTITADPSTSVSYSTIYTPTQPRPDIVVPEQFTSFATPIVSSAAAMLISASQAHPSWSKFNYTTGKEFPGDNSTRAMQAAQNVYSADSSEVLRAALMAGADRFVALNSTNGSSITDYRSAGNQTSNGLDKRFGAGQLNVYNSYHILAAGEQNSKQDSIGSPVDIAPLGFDYDNAFGTAQTQADYEFVSTGGNFRATLAWNVEINILKTMPTYNNLPNTYANFSTAGTLYNLDLELFDLTTGGGPVTISNSTDENTESIMADLIAGDRYQMRVFTSSPLATDTEYGLAWISIPEPSSVIGIFGIGIVFIVSIARKKSLSRVSQAA